MAVGHAGLVGLGTAYYDAVLPVFHHMEEQIRIGLLMRSLGAVALGIGHGAVHSEIVILAVHHELFEILMVAGPVLLINFVGGGKHGVKGIHPHAALETGGGLLAQKALHLHFFHQVLRGLVDVGKAIDLLPRVGGHGGHQVLVLRYLSQVVGHTHRIERGPQNGVVHRAVNPLSEHIDLQIQPADTLDVLFAGHQGHNCTLPFVIQLYSQLLRRGWKTA